MISLLGSWDTGFLSPLGGGARDAPGMDLLPMVDMTALLGRSDLAGRVPYR